MKNPEVKKGDKIIVKESNNGQQIPLGVEGVVTQIGTMGNFNVRINNRTYAVYNTQPSDVYMFADRKSQIESLKTSIKCLKKDLEAKEKDLKYLEKYETEEDAVADKLDQILTAHATNKDSKSRVNAIAEVLKELKSSHLL